eukprot:9485762-Pyramimonas_sp.AAC.2
MACCDPYLGAEAGVPVLPSLELGDDVRHHLVPCLHRRLALCPTVRLLRLCGKSDRRTDRQTVSQSNSRTDIRERLSNRVLYQVVFSGVTIHLILLLGFVSQRERSFDITTELVTYSVASRGADLRGGSGVRCAGASESHGAPMPSTAAASDAARGPTRTLNPYLATPPLQNSIAHPNICGR